MIASIIVILLLLCTLFGTIVFMQSRIIKNYKNENTVLRAGMNNTAARLERIHEHINKNKKAEEAVNAERKALETTPDGGLAGRANNLFSSVRFNGGNDGDGAA
ncbi:MAG: hypothetical protein LBC77_06285 [Spirochaetaceae bacterium]|jgi:hypothetical protein|nr:hypothetical protein [Spirochaetaceae bacterium]